MRSADPWGDPRLPDGPQPMTDRTTAVARGVCITTPCARLQASTLQVDAVGQGRPPRPPGTRSEQHTARSAAQPLRLDRGAHRRTRSRRPAPRTAPQARAVAAARPRRQRLPRPDPPPRGHPGRRRLLHALGRGRHRLPAGHRQHRAARGTRSGDRRLHRLRSRARAGLRLRRQPRRRHRAHRPRHPAGLRRRQPRLADRRLPAVQSPHRGRAARRARRRTQGARRAHRAGRRRQRLGLLRRRRRGPARRTRRRRTADGRGPAGRRRARPRRARRRRARRPPRGRARRCARRGVHSDPVQGARRTGRCRPRPRSRHRPPRQRGPHLHLRHRTGSGRGRSRPRCAAAAAARAREGGPCPGRRPDLPPAVHRGRARRDAARRLRRLPPRALAVRSRHLGRRVPLRGSERRLLPPPVRPGRHLPPPHHVQRQPDRRADRHIGGHDHRGCAAPLGRVLEVPPAPRRLARTLAALSESSE
ncbi:hypothetical protein SBRY_90201 [Actinacidiphila bryophytorum]|uniref:Uncharacterized protein n=1 Tax=Actinacidiphila bryophytorum TaxID=1436133 RepID=A0A9W4H8Q8_9ACTN|nr:hypothetical protein SBRY_90201 [Actinacidiphila bryophytorum]